MTKGRVSSVRGTTPRIIREDLYISKALFFLFQRKFGRNLIDSNYFYLQKTTIAYWKRCLPNKRLTNPEQEQSFKPVPDAFPDHFNF